MHSEIDFADRDANRTKADIEAAIAYYEAIPANERSGDDVDQLKYLKGVLAGMEHNDWLNYIESGG